MVSNFRAPICPRTGRPCTRSECFLPSWCGEQIDAETDAIMALSDEEVMAQHLKLYGGDEKLAKRAIEMMKARIEEILARHWKQ